MRSTAARQMCPAQHPPGPEGTPPPPHPRAVLPGAARLRPRRAHKTSLQAWCAWCPTPASPGRLHLSCRRSCCRPLASRRRQLYSPELTATPGCPCSKTGATNLSLLLAGSSLEAQAHAPAPSARRSGAMPAACSEVLSLEAFEHQISQAGPAAHLWGC